MRKFDFYANVGPKFQSRFIACSENSTFNVERFWDICWKKRLKNFLEKLDTSQMKIKWDSSLKVVCARYTFASLLLYV